MIYCKKCGRELTNTGGFCYNCSVTSAAPTLTQQGDVDHHRLVSALERIANALESIANCTDGEKNALRMFDIERANVYKTHLGEKLRSEPKGANDAGKPPLEK